MHVLLLSVDPAGQSHEKKLPWVKDVHEHDSTTLGDRAVTSITTGACARSYIWTLRGAWGSLGVLLVDVRRSGGVDWTLEPRHGAAFAFGIR